MIAKFKILFIISILVLLFSPFFILADAFTKAPFYSDWDILPMSINTAGIDPRTNRADEKMLLNPQMLNRYAYGLNNPYRYIDPNGKNPILIAAGLIFLGELIYPQTLESPHKDSFIDRYSTDLLLLPLGVQFEGAQILSKGLKN